MYKEFESRHFSGPKIDYIDETKERERRKSSERGSIELAEERGPPSEKVKGAKVK